MFDRLPPQTLVPANNLQERRYQHFLLPYVDSDKLLQTHTCAIPHMSVDFQD